MGRKPDKGDREVIGVYLRTSTNKQDTDAQRYALAEWVRKRGYPQSEIIEFVDEGVSGATSSRNGWQDLVAAVEAGKLERICTFEASRLSRDFLSLLSFYQLCYEHGVVIETPDEGEQSFETPLDKIVAAIKAFAASSEREHIRKRISAGMAKAKADGKRIGAQPGTQQALGFRKNYLEDPDTRKVAQQILEMRKAGVRKSQIASILGTSYSFVQRVLRRHG